MKGISATETKNISFVFIVILFWWLLLSILILLILGGRLKSALHIDYTVSSLDMYSSFFVSDSFTFSCKVEGCIFSPPYYFVVIIIILLSVYTIFWFAFFDTYLLANCRTLIRFSGTLKKETFIFIGLYHLDI